LEVSTTSGIIENV